MWLSFTVHGTRDVLRSLFGFYISSRWPENHHYQCNAGSRQEKRQHFQTSRGKWRKLFCHYWAIELLPASDLQPANDLVKLLRPFFPHFLHFSFCLSGLDSDYYKKKEITIRPSKNPILKFKK